MGSSSSTFKVDDLPDLTGQNIVITGGTAGLGLASAVALASKGAKVIITARSKDKGEAAVENIRKQIASLPKTSKNDFSSLSIDIFYGVMELQSLESVKTFSKWFLELNIPLHVLMLNAGISSVPEKVIYHTFTF